MTQLAYPGQTAIVATNCMNGYHPAQQPASQGATEGTRDAESSTIAVESPQELHDAHWSWACRMLSEESSFGLKAQAVPPNPGDVVLVQVDRIGNHTKLMTNENERLRIYVGDTVVGVMGNRYATDAYEAEVIGAHDLCLLTNAGMIGTLLSKNQKFKSPTKLTFLGYITDESGRRLNLKQRLFRPKAPGQLQSPILFVVGSGMNSGKTTTAVKLVKALTERGTRVAACKLTGSVSYNDYSEYAATKASHVCDFSDYGFPSTYLASNAELIGLFHTMMQDAAATRPDITVVEIADGILQRETKMLLECPEIRQRISGVILAANCASSALFGLDQLHQQGHEVPFVSGLITSSPLFVREYVTGSSTPIVSSAGRGKELADRVLAYMQQPVNSSVHLDGLYGKES